MFFDNTFPLVPQFSSPFKTYFGNLHLAAQMVKCLLAMWETWVQSLGQEDPLEKEMAAHASTLAWKIPWMVEPGRLQSRGSERVWHDWATSRSLLKDLFNSTSMSQFPLLLSISTAINLVHPDPSHGDDYYSFPISFYCCSGLLSTKQPVTT